MRKMFAALVMTAMLFSTAACGDKEAETAPKQDAPVVQTTPEPTHSTEVPEQKVVEPVTVSEEEIRNTLGVDESGFVTVKGQTCEAAVVMTTPAMIDMYMEAGDMVALNPDSTIGVKVIGDPAVCMQDFVHKLSVL